MGKHVINIVFFMSTLMGMKINATHSMHAVILAGGNGERLWPYTRAEKPKYLLPFRDKRSLLIHTIDRVRSIADHVWIVTSQLQQSLIEEHLQDPHVHIIAEPCGRDTAAAILLSVLTIESVDPNACIAFLPADHFVPDEQLFSSALSRAATHSIKQQRLCLLGLTPRYPATQYGYIHADNTHDKNSGAQSVLTFCEKPSRVVAEQYILDGDKLWNLGIFVAPLKQFITLFETHAPDILKQMRVYRASLKAQAYACLKKISFDYAILEKSSDISVLPVSFAWDDVGCLDTFLSLQPAKKDIKSVISVDAHNNLIDVPGKLVALIGVDDLCIIEHEGALVIVPRDRVQEVRKVVLRLKNQK